MTTEIVHVSFYERRPGAASVCIDTETLTFTPVRCRNSFTDWESGEYYPEYNGEPEDFVRCCGFGVGFDVFKVSVKKDPENGSFVATMESTVVCDILKEDWERWAPLEGKIEGKMTFFGNATAAYQCWISQDPDINHNNTGISVSPNPSRKGVPSRNRNHRPTFRYTDVFISDHRITRV